jgi:PAS domain S-box-containing protein
MYGFKSLTVKLLAIYLTLVALSALILFSVLEFRTFLADRDKLLKNLQNVLSIQSSPVEAALWEVNAEEVQKIVDDIGALAQVEGVLVRAVDGQLVARAGIADAQLDKPEYRATQQLVYKSEFFQEPVGTLQITVHDRSIRNALKERLAVDGAVMAFMIIVLGVGTIATTNLLIGRPLSLMLRSIDKFKRENVREQVEWQSADELGQVVNSYNEMQITQAEAEVSLLKARDELELRVEERTRELAEKEAELRMALDNMPGGIMMIDDDMTIQLFNERYVELYELPEGLLQIGGSLVEMIKFRAKRGDYGRGDPDTLVQARVGGYDERDVQVMENKLPSGRVVELTRNPLPNGVLVAICTDITERKLAEETLAEQKAVIEAVLTNMDQGVVMYDGDLIVTTFNEQARQYMRLPEDLMYVGASFADINKYAKCRRAPGTGETEAKTIEQLKNFKVGDAYSLEYIHPDGDVIEIRRRSIPGGGFVATQTDITDRKRAEEQIREREQQFMMILESAPVGVSVTDNNRTRLMVNQRYADLAGIPQEELLGDATANEWTSAEDREEYRKIFAKDKRVIDMEFEVRRGDGSTAWVMASAIALEFSGKPVQVNWVVDLSDRKKAEEEITKAHNLITESVTYAANIQLATLPLPELLSVAFTDHFVIWEPRDVVGGDMYWCLPFEGGYVLAVADCTGHGVPGAFITLVASGALHHALDQTPDAEPAALIKSMNYFIKEILAQYTHDSPSDDGLEIGVCRISEKNGGLDFAGARFSLWHSINGKMREIKGDKTGIGYCNVPLTLNLATHHVSTKEDSQFYMFSDGFNDQIGGDKGRGFGKRRMLDLLTRHADKTMSNQREAIQKAFTGYQGDELRRDDLTMVGFKL